jgi:hypothetical protein
MSSTTALRRGRLAPLLLLLLLPACAEEEDPTQRDSNLNVPEDYATPQLAAAAARAGDQIIVSYRAAAYVGDLDLPAGVSLIGHVENPLLPRITGQVTVNGGGPSVEIERLRIDNPAGSGLRLIGSACSVEELWIHDCDGPGIELIGNAPAHITACDIERCGPAVLIRDTTVGGHYGDAEHPAARITDNNFLENGPAGNLDNLVFANIPVLYTVYVEYNHWGEGVAGPEAINETIVDNKDDPAIKGLAFTEPEDPDDIFSWWPTPVDHWWQE